ncbi:MAG: DUF2142 domain-containing protein [Clostridia bacterium]|nr:DUF2142 domain-containing protein [Clostridia bacterium]MBR3255733.1 DUF2142 domain-containing protein [Clostridia bacterium]
MIIKNILNKKFIQVTTFILYIMAFVVFEIGYCNSANVINFLNGNKDDINYNFSLCRFLVFLGFLLILFIKRKSFNNDTEKSLEYKLKRILIYLYLSCSVIITIVALYIILKNPIIIRAMSIGIITILMSGVFVLNVSNNIIKNVIVITFSVGIVFSISANYNHAIDEKKHFMTAFNIASGNFDYKNHPITDKKVNDLPQLTRYTNIDEFFSERYIPELTDDVNMEDTPSTPAIYNFVPYLFSATGIFIAKVLGGSIIDLYILGRIFNLIEYCILICIAIKLLPYKKNIFAVVFMMPMALLLAGTYSIDGYCIGMVSILIAYCLKLKEEKETISLKDFIKLTLIFGLTLFAKSMAYILVAGIFLMLPIIKTIKSNRKYIPWMIFATIVSVIIFIIAVIMVKKTYIISDTRAQGTINPTEQLNVLLYHPIFDIKLILTQIKETILNFNWWLLLHQNVFFTNDAQCLFMPLALFILYVSLTEDDKNLKIKDKLIMTISFFMVYLMTSMVLYLSFTEVGTMHVAGYQTRYILPVLPLVLICVSNNKVKYMNKENRNINIAIVSTIFIGISILQNIIVK